MVSFLCGKTNSTLSSTLASSVSIMTLHKRLLRSWVVSLIIQFAGKWTIHPYHILMITCLYCGLVKHPMFLPMPLLGSLHFRHWSLPWTDHNHPQPGYLTQIQWWLIPIVVVMFDTVFNICWPIGMKWIKLKPSSLKFFDSNGGESFFVGWP